MMKNLNTKNIISWVLTCFLCLVLGNVDAQSVKRLNDLDKKSKKLFTKAKIEGRKKKHKKSLQLYNKLLKKHPEFIDGQLLKAGMLHNLGKYEESAETFEKVIAMAPEYHPKVYFSLGVVYKDMERYDLAAQNFQFFLDRAEGTSKLKRAEVLRDRTAFMDYAIKNPVPFSPEKVKGGVNTEESEYVPQMNLEGDRMIFTRRVDQQEDFYIAEFKDGEFVRVTEIAAMNTPQNEGIHTMSSDGKTLIFTACDRRKTGVGSCDLYIARLDSRDWSIASNMGKVINSINWDAQPSLSADGKKLFFSSNRQFGHGKNDLWMSTRTDTSGWTIPVVLPDHINTPGNEESPFIHPDGHTLYFRSDRHVGMGGFDIFYTRYIDSTKTWGPVTNIGYPINTLGDEGALSVSLDGKTAFFASDMAYIEDKANANLDIYTFELYEEARPLLTTFIKGKIIDRITKKPVEARFIIESLDKTMNPITGVADKNGGFINSLPTNENYGFFVEADGYLLYSENYELTGVKDALHPFLVEIELTPIPKKEDKVVVNTPIILENIFFEIGSADLRTTSDAAISKLAKNLNKNPHLKIQILGHTDNVGQESDNQVLSEARAKSVMVALTEKGIDPIRILYKGLGETQPIATNDTEEGRRSNRRTEFVIVN